MTTLSLEAMWDHVEYAAFATGEKCCPFCKERRIVFAPSTMARSKTYNMYFYCTCPLFIEESKSKCTKSGHIIRQIADWFFDPLFGRTAAAPNQAGMATGPDAWLLVTNVGTWIPRANPETCHKPRVFEDTQILRKREISIPAYLYICC